MPAILLFIIMLISSIGDPNYGKANTKEIEELKQEILTNLRQGLKCNTKKKQGKSK